MERSPSLAPSAATGRSQPRRVAPPRPQVTAHQHDFAHGNWQGGRRDRRAALAIDKAIFDGIRESQADALTIVVAHPAQSDVRVIRLVADSKSQPCSAPPTSFNVSTGARSVWPEDAWPAEVGEGAEPAVRRRRTRARRRHQGAPGGPAPRAPAPSRRGSAASGVTSPVHPAPASLPPRALRSLQQLGAGRPGSGRPRETIATAHRSRRVRVDGPWAGAVSRRHDG